MALNRPQAPEDDENQPPAAASTSRAHPVASGSRGGPSTPLPNRVPSTSTWHTASPSTTSFQFVADIGTPVAPRTPSLAFNAALEFNPHVYSRPRAPPPYW